MTQLRISYALTSNNAGFEGTMIETDVKGECCARAC